MKYVLQKKKTYFVIKSDISLHFDKFGTLPCINFLTPFDTPTGMTLTE